METTVMKVHFTSVLGMSVCWAKRRDSLKINAKKWDPSSVCNIFYMRAMFEKRWQGNSFVGSYTNRQTLLSKQYSILGKVFVLSCSYGLTIFHSRSYREVCNYSSGIVTTVVTCLPIQIDYQRKGLSTDAVWTAYFL